MDLDRAEKHIHRGKKVASALFRVLQEYTHTWSRARYILKGLPRRRVIRIPLTSLYPPLPSGVIEQPSLRKISQRNTEHSPVVC